MTEGHKHRVVRLKDGWLYRALKHPLAWSRDYERLDASPYPWRAKNEQAFKDGLREQPYCLSLLGILHRWTGLTITLKERDA